MAALKEWNNKYGVKRNHTVEISGVKYVIGGKTSAQKSLGRPDNQGLWCLVGWTGYLRTSYARCYAWLLKKEGVEHLSNNHQSALKRKLFYELFNRMTPVATGSENQTERELLAFQLDFYKYCVHDSVLCFYLVIVLVLTFQRLKRTSLKKGVKACYLAYFDQFQEDMLKAFLKPIWAFPTQSPANSLPQDIDITQQQGKELILLAKPIYKLFKQHCKAVFEEMNMPELHVQTKTDLFTICWPDVASAMDEICKKIKFEDVQ